MAGVTGLEPAASCVTGRRSNQLSYTPATFIIAVKNFKTAYILYFKFIVFKYFLMSYILIFSKPAVYSRFSAFIACSLILIPSKLAVYSRFSILGLYNL